MSCTTVSSAPERRHASHRYRPAAVPNLRTGHEAEAQGGAVMLWWRFEVLHSPGVHVVKASDAEAIMDQCGHEIEQCSCRFCRRPHSGERVCL